MVSLEEGINFCSGKDLPLRLEAARCASGNSVNTRFNRASYMKSRSIEEFKTFAIVELIMGLNDV